MKRRNVVIFLALMGIFVTYTQAFTVETIQTKIEFTSLNKYTGPEEFLTTYEIIPLGKNKVMGTLSVTNQIGSDATIHVAIFPIDSNNDTITIGAVSTFDYKINDGSWTEASYSDATEMFSKVDMSITNGGQKTLYVIFEKTDIATSYYRSTIVIKEKSTS